MISGVITRLKWRKQIKRWRLANVHNETTMCNQFNMDLVKVGKGTYGPLTILNFSENIRVSIGNYCSIASGVVLAACSEHAIDTISTYPYKVKVLGIEKTEALSKGDIIIDDDVWIGQNAIILSGVHIGQGAIVAAGAIVTKDVPPYAIVAGNPAKILKYRFKSDMIDLLVQVDFSRLDHELIEEHIEDLYKKLESPSQLEWLPKK